MSMYSQRNLSKLTIDDFARLFGTTADDIDEYCKGLVDTMDFSFEQLSDIERDKLILNILKRIDLADLPVSGEERKPEWEKGWADNLRDFINSGYDLSKLVPKYFKKNIPVRLNREYVMPVDPDFVLNCTRVFRNWIFRKYLKDVDSIYEFGCGPATHLAFLAGIYPGKKLYGLDWAKPSQEIIRLLAKHFGWQIEGRHFDFFAPDVNLHLDENSAVYTFGALEQIGGNHKAFLQFLLKESFKLCINVECISEFYNQDYLPDYLAFKYHKRRNYLDGYLTRLQELEAEGKIIILAMHHQQFGNIYDDSHSYVVWKLRKIPATS
ncbi:MAG: hypothetical protein DCC43_15240 [Candidatus Brocadia sp.]|nr:class I SAM-dependent methyltransferase [Candidatus Brocadia sp.]MCE7911337.1 class I SAM-dependent methyltransferase [Candidatus Brocadia sp. AMX3]MDG5995908.1 class I SAM-dependent methyltransferase [Candidatus Brocadia sp.]RIJ89645.1 MAG: hypothetical protein DCC43_15240 [Candidatus Brocadia sp.]UJS21025.1 MAG: class I SAM-dependent methyltransferase [Candidatus Brocadia sp.]